MPVGSHNAPRASPLPERSRLAPVVAVGVTGLLIALGNRYGLHRDELYFLEAGRHLAWGYPDQPAGAPVLARMSAAVFGDSVRGVHAVAALSTLLLVLLAAAVARQLGGSPRAQAMSALMVGTCGFVLAVGHFISTNTFDLLGWTLILYLVCRTVRGPERWSTWILIGAVAGATLHVKVLVLLLIGSLVLGVLVASKGRVSSSIVFRCVAAGVIALVMWSPYLVWQASHAWPQIELVADISDEYGAGRWFVPLDLLLVAGPPVAIIWISGIVWLTRARPAPLRAIGFAMPIALVTVILAGGKGLYLTGFLPVAFAAGAVAIDPFLDRVRGRLIVGTAIALATAIGAVVTLPLLPERWLHRSPVPALNEDALEMVGWPDFVDEVADVADAVRQDDAEEQSDHAVIFTRNYGEAGALLWLGRDRDLPPVYSGHNGFHEWGPPPDGAAPVIVVGYRLKESIERDFVGCERRARIDNRAGVDNEERGGGVWVCTEPRVPWAKAWPGLQRFAA